MYKRWLFLIMGVLMPLSTIFQYMYMCISEKSRSELQEIPKVRLSCGVWAIVVYQVSFLRMHD
jgi:hypothetical protein